MSDNAESASIDLSVNADAALQTFQDLASAARAADAELQQLKTDMAAQVNQAFGSALGTTVDYNHAANIVRGLPQADIAAVVPGVPVLQQQIAERGAQITGQAMDFTSANPPAAGQPIPALLAQFQEAGARQAEQSQRQQEARQAQPTAPASVPSGALPGTPVSTAARYGLVPASTPLSPFGQPGASTNDTTQQDRAGTQLGDRIAESLSRYAGGMVTGGISGGANVAGMGAAGDLVGALMRPLMEMVSMPLAMGASLIGGAAGIGFGVNGLQARYAGEERQLAGSIGTSTGATPEGELATAQNTGWRYWYHEKDSVAAAQQLGDMGVQSNQMGGALTQSMALARLSGVGLDQTTALTGQMMQGGMSSNQVGQAYAELDQVSKLVPVSLGRITEGIKAVNAAAGVGQISINGLAATQALSDTTGMKINIGQAMAGTIGSTGTSALAQGYMLGLDPAQFDAAQKDPAKLWDAYANTARRYDVGAGGERIAQQALSESGFDFSSMKGGQANTFIQKLVSEGPGAAQKYEQSLQQKENAPHAAGPHTADQFAAAGKAFADQVTPIGDKLKIGGEQAANNLVHGAQTAAAALAAVRANPGNAAALLHYERLTNGQAYANDPNAAGQMDASSSSQFGPLSEYDLSQARQSGVWTGGGPGKGSFVDAVTFHAYEASARKTGTPLAVLLAQGKQEATINGVVDPLAGTGPGHGGTLPGIGLGQWTPGPHNENLPTIEKYLGAASKDLGLGPVTASNWRQAALNPRISALGTGLYDRDLYAHSGDNWAKALAPYNGTGPQAQAYGLSVNSDAQKIEIQLGGSIELKQDGKTVGTAQAGQHIKATHTSHSIDPSKKHVAARSYGPADRTPPAPGIPTLPGHIGGPIRR